jgi:transcriptional regulator with GAF, ATPase, and Fis domain
MYNVYAASSNGNLSAIPKMSLSAIGGSKSTGHQIPDLKNKEDYLLLAQNKDEVVIHPLVGKNKTPKKITEPQVIMIDDLVLCFVEADETKVLEPKMGFINELSDVVHGFAQPEKIEMFLFRLIELLLKNCLMQKGLVITKDLNGEFQTVASANVKKDEPWLSETLVQNVIEEKKPVFIQNIIGSPFDKKKSLMATGFLSVCAWPLIERGEVLGVLVIGSKQPHSGLSLDEKKYAELLVHIASLMVRYYLDDQSLRAQIAAYRKKDLDMPLLTDDKKLIDTCQLASKVANSDLAVLIQGETGVGKEVMANWIHAQSDRNTKPFIAVNCGAIPSELLESTLFGHKKGSFTGAHADQVGKFAQANGGTIFLDEIGDLPMSLQVKLLRVLQEKIVEPLGSNQPQKINVRIISASHKNLTDLVNKNLFRSDLFFRLAEVSLHIPSIRERRSDIALLATTYLRDNYPEKRLSEKATRWLSQNNWPGNVRELFSTLKRGAILASSEYIETEDFTKGVATHPTITAEDNWLGGKNLEQARDLFLKAKVREALDRTSGNRAQAASLLGVTPRTLFRYLEDMQPLTDESL